MPPTKNSSSNIKTFSRLSIPDLMRRKRALELEMGKRGITPTIEDRLSGPAYSNYQQRPVPFVRNILKAQPWSKQREILNAIRDHSRVSVRSCHDVGKTFITACAALWFLYSHGPNAIVITTAPTWRQVRSLLWREVRALHSRAGLWGKPSQTELDLDNKWFAMGFSTKEPDRFQGFHEEHLLLIVDEAAGVPELIFEAAEGILTNENAKIALIGNPTSSSGTFYDSHTERLKQDWYTVHIGAEMSPNFTGEGVLPQISKKLISPKWVEGRKRAWGEDNPLYQAKVLGNFPDQGEDSLFSTLWIDIAEHIVPDILPDDEIVFGVDLARKGSAENVVYIRHGNRIIYFEAWREPDTNKTLEKLEALARIYKPSRINVDAVGLGGPIADQLRAHGFPAIDVVSNARSSDPALYGMLRDEIYWHVASNLMRYGLIGPLTDGITQGQLTSIKRSYDKRTSKLKVESKEEMEKRGLPSPDRADALVLCFMPTVAVNDDTNVVEATDEFYYHNRQVDIWRPDQDLVY